MSTLNAVDTVVDGPYKSTNPVVMDEAQPTAPVIESPSTTSQEMHKLKKMNAKKEKKSKVAKKEKKDRKEAKKDAKKQAKKDGKKIDKKEKLEQKEARRQGSSLQWSSDSESSSSPDLRHSGDFADPVAAEARHADKARRKEQRHREMERRRAARAEKFAAYILQLRVHSPALARDEEDLALSKNTYVAARTAYKQHRDQYRSHKMALLLARKQYKLAHPEHSSSSTTTSGGKLKSSKGNVEKVTEEKLALQRAAEDDEELKKTTKGAYKKSHKKHNKKHQLDDSSSASSSDSSSASSSDSESDSGSSSSSSDSDYEDGPYGFTSDDDSLEFDADGVTVLGREAAINAKANRAHMRLEVHQLRVVQRHARVTVKRKEKQLRRHYKSEKHQNSELSKLDRKRDKIEDERAEKIVALHAPLTGGVVSASSPRSRHTAAVHSTDHHSAPRKDITSTDLSHAAPSATVPVPATADYKVATALHPMVGPEDPHAAPLTGKKPEHHHHAHNTHHHKEHHHVKKESPPAAAPAPASTALNMPDGPVNATAAPAAPLAIVQPATAPPVDRNMPVIVTPATDSSITPVQ